MIKEHPSNCPYCGEPILLLVDHSAGEQHYFEDCEVCCRPILIKLHTATAEEGYFLELYREDD